MKLLKGDTVIVIAGGNSKRNNDKGKTGEIIAVDTKHNTVTVKGVNVVVKHVKPNQQKQEGSIETFEAPIDASNVAYYDTKAKKIVKIGYAMVDGKKVRIDKSTGLPLGQKAKKATKKVEKAEETPVVEEKPAVKKTAAKKAAPKAEGETAVKKSTAKKSTKKVEEAK